jgi:hypothetical protein
MPHVGADGVAPIERFVEFSGGGSRFGLDDKVTTGEKGTLTAGSLHSRNRDP